jgi:pyruvate dehydrogenase E1 component
LAEKYGIATDLWSVTSYSEICRDAVATTRWNRLHPGETPKKSYLDELFNGQDGVYVAASDNVRLVPDQIREWIPGTYVTLGTDGFGRSDTRDALRRHFEVDAASITYATLEALSRRGQFDKSKLPGVIKDLGINPDQINPIKA